MPGLHTITNTSWLKEISQGNLPKVNFLKRNEREKPQKPLIDQIYKFDKYIDK